MRLRVATFLITGLLFPSSLASETPRPLTLPEVYGCRFIAAAGRTATAQSYGPPSAYGTAGRAFELGGQRTGAPKAGGILSKGVTNVSNNEPTDCPRGAPRRRA
jgi:hypothetical protein